MTDARFPDDGSGCFPGGAALAPDPNGPSGVAGGRLIRGALLLLALLAAPAGAQSRDWTAEKCSRYSQVWPEALARFGRVGLSDEFIARHEGFIASGCRTRDVCPRSPQEIAMADVMTIAAMNAGTASTFVPFICRD